MRSELRQRFHLDRPYFLSVSCDVGRKSSPELLAQFLKLAERGCTHDLVMVWRHPPEYVTAMVEANPEGQKVHLLPFVSDSDLRLLYCGATAMLFPSKYEGFGLPVLEAMACGTPVVTCNAASLPEVGGDAVIYIQPGDDAALHDVMAAFLDNGHDRQNLREKGRAQAARFSWERTARETLQVYSDALEIS
ncbi:MAG: glycosyltransferase family 1 protein [Planctomycetota bacterium]|nr:glycosyltransferase family 1 protein [Planctomycetota bacterium]